MGDIPHHILFWRFVMYKEDVIYKEWTRKIKSIREKYFRIKNKKRYINRPYFEKDTVLDDSLMTADDMKKELECSLRSGLAQYILAFYADSINVIDFEPLYPSYEFKGKQIYEVRKLSVIKSIEFLDANYYCKNLSYTYKGLMSVTNKISFSNSLIDYLRLQYKTILNSRYGFSDSCFKEHVTHLCIVVNNMWKIFIDINLNEETIPHVIKTLYYAGVTSFTSIAGITNLETFIEDICMNVKYEEDTKLFTDVLNYDKPSKFRVKLFELLRDVDNFAEIAAGHFVYNNIPFYSFLNKNGYKTNKNNVMGFINQYVVELLSAMHKYGDIVDNVEDIGL